MTMPKLVQDFIPKSNGNRPGYAMTPEYITVHETGNQSDGANAEMHARFIKNPTTAASWHITVDDGDTAIQHLPFNENGWHCGDGANGPGNRKSIGIEICVNRDGNFEKAKNRAAFIIRHLMDRFNIPMKNVVQHWDWSHKNCPQTIRATEGFPAFKQRIPASVDSKPAKPTAPAAAKSIAQMADEVIAQKHGNGHDNRRKSLGISAAEYEKVRAEVNRRAKSPKPAPKPKPQTKEYVNLPASAQTWRTYKTNVAPVAKNSDWSLTPAKFGGLTYEVLARPQTDVVTINTSRGRRNIYVARSTGATFARR